MRIIVAIGGGEIRTGETFAIDRAIVELAGKSKPRHLFIPTASGEPEPYIETISRVYGNQLGCQCSALRLKGRSIDDKAISSLIEDADIIYVGGGDTGLMLTEWRRFNVIPHLQAALARGAILSGLSAGSICWFEQGISDTNGFSGDADWDYCMIDGMGFIGGCHSPHFDGRRSEAKFRKFLKTNDTPFVGIENNCAMVVEDESYRIIRSEQGKNAYTVSAGIEGQIPDKGKLADLDPN